MGYQLGDFTMPKWFSNPLSAMGWNWGTPRFQTPQQDLVIGKSVDVTWISLVKFGSFGLREECGKRSHCLFRSFVVCLGFDHFRGFGLYKGCLSKVSSCFFNVFIFLWLGISLWPAFFTGAEPPTSKQLTANPSFTAQLSYSHGQKLEYIYNITYIYIIYTSKLQQTSIGGWSSINW